jgi:hypothetical protein
LFNGFVGYVVVCVQQTTKKKQADKHTRKETTKKERRKTAQEKHKWKLAECDHVKKSEAESFRHMKIRISYTPEDGHIGRNM